MEQKDKTVFQARKRRQKIGAFKEWWEPRGAGTHVSFMLSGMALSGVRKPTKNVNCSIQYFRSVLESQVGRGFPRHYGEAGDGGEGSTNLPGFSF
jgi:hypothetical protein